MAKAHPFNFAGGEELSHMGATWFVSYAYYCCGNEQHMAWKGVKTYLSRMSIFSRTGKYHTFWLQQVLLMEDKRLNTNSLGVSASTTKRMAREILQNKRELIK